MQAVCQPPYGTARSKVPVSRQTQSLSCCIGEQACLFGKHSEFESDGRGGLRTLGNRRLRAIVFNGQGLGSEHEPGALGASAGGERSEGCRYMKVGVVL